MSRTGNKIKNIVVAVIAIFMAYQMCGAAAGIEENANLQTGFGAPLTIAMQLVFWTAIIVLCTMAFQNILEFYVLWRYKDNEEIKGNARKVIKFTIYVKIVVSLAMRLVISFLFIVLACVAFFAPGVRARDGGVYGAGVFMLALAGFLAYSNIRVAVARVREIKGIKDTE